MERIFNKRFLPVTCVFYFLVAIILLKSNLEAQEVNPTKKIKIAVFNFLSDVPLSSYSSLIRNYIEYYLYDTGKFQLLERGQIERVVGEKRIRGSDAEKKDSLLKIGRRLASDYIIIGSLDELKNKSEFEICVRVISIEEGEILGIYSRKINSAQYIKSESNRISERIARDIYDFQKRGRIRSGALQFHNIYLGAAFNYIYPVLDFGKLVSHGFGFTVNIDIENTGLNNFIFGFQMGYYRFTGKRNSSDSCSFIPIDLCFGYNIDISRYFYMRFFLDAGINIIILKHGKGEGFNMPENSEKTTVDPANKFGVFFCFAPMHDFQIITGARYGLSYEKDGVIHFMAATFGFAYVF